MTDVNWLNTIDRLLHRVQRQDQSALKALYDESAQKLFAIALRIVGDQAEAEDVLQEVFVKIWKQAKQYSGSGTAWGWMCVLTRHSAIDRQRSLKSHLHDSLDTVAPNDQWQQISEMSDNTLWVDRCLQQLKPDMRKAILLSYVTGYSHGEISEVLSKPLGTVKAWVRRGLQELKQCLAA